MKRNFLLLILTLSCIQFLKPMLLYSQTNFKEGVIVSASGDTLKGEINFLGWNKSPSSITFRETTTSDPKTITPNDIEFFSVAGKRYVSRFVTIDQTPIVATELPENDQTQIEKRVFLKIIVQGTISLYEYKHSRVNFYIENIGIITELISHQYIIDTGTYESNSRSTDYIINQNEFKYRRQLKELLKCREEPELKVAYTAKSLQQYIVNCNRGVSKFVFYSSKEKGMSVEHSIFTGLNISSFNHLQNQGISLPFVLSPNEQKKTNLLINYDIGISYNLGYKIKLRPTRKPKGYSVSLSIAISEYNFNTDKETTDLIYIRDNTELIKISRIKTTSNSLNLSLWYSRRFKEPRDRFFFELGITNSSYFNKNATALFNVNVNHNNDLRDVEVPVQKSRDIELNTPENLIGAFVGVGYETSKIYLVIRGASLGEKLLSYKKNINQNYISVSVGYKF